MVNVRTGGVTKISGMIHGLVLAGIVLIAAPLAAKIPMAVLAGILVKVGFDIIDFKYIKTAFKGPRWDFLVMMTVLILTVFWNLIFAVGIGVFMAALGYVKLIADDQTETVNQYIPNGTLEDEAAVLKAADGKVMLYDFGGPLSFGAAADLGHHIRQRVKAGVDSIVLDFTRMTFIDVSAARAVETIAMDAADDGKSVYTVGMNETVKAKLKGLDIYKGLDESKAYNSRLDALKAAAAG